MLYEAKLLTADVYLRKIVAIKIWTANSLPPPHPHPKMNCSFAFETHFLSLVLVKSGNSGYKAGIFWFIYTFASRLD
jgi:hypothetical protein